MFCYCIAFSPMNSIMFTVFAACILLHVRLDIPLEYELNCFPSSDIMRLQEGTICHSVYMYMCIYIPPL